VVRSARTVGVIESGLVGPERTRSGRSGKISRTFVFPCPRRTSASGISG